MSTSPLSPPRRFRRRPRAKVVGRSPDSGDGLDELRRLLLAPEQQRLANVEERLSADSLGNVLPEATVASQNQGDGLAVALSPTIVAAIRNAAQREPRLFVEAIVPVMGPAIRKSVTQALRALVQQLNETLARGLSLQGLRWRWEAARTGRPFAEVVLLRSLLYRVEQVFLIHEESGLVLRHLVAPGIPQQDPDQVAAMLTAIDAFVHDAFREDARLGRFQVGELVGWVEHGPLAILVAVVRGTAPDSYAEVLREVQERVHVDLHEELAHFKGDDAPFARAEPILETCLRSEAAPSARPKKKRYHVQALAFAIFAAVVALVAFHLHRTHAEQKRFASLVDAIRREPGYVVTSARDDSGRYTLEGLRDPLAAPPEALLAREGARPKSADLRFSPFYSLDPRLSRERATAVLKPPPTTALAFERGVLSARGSAPGGWIDGARLLAPTLPGVARFDTSGLVDEGAREELDRVGKRLAAIPILFPLDSTDPSRPEARAALDDAAALVKKMLALAPAANTSFQLAIVGHADTRGTERRNQALSADRAERVAHELVLRGVPRSLIANHRGAGVDDVSDSQACADGRSHGSACARRVDVKPEFPER